MKANWQQTSDLKGILTVEHDVEAVDKAVKEALAVLSHKYPVRGFRPGRVSYSVFVSRYGKEVLYNEAQNILINDSIGHALSDVDVVPDETQKPKLLEDEMTDLVEKQPFIYKIEFTIGPEMLWGRFRIDLDKYKGLKVDKLVIEPKEVTEEDVDAVFSDIRLANALWKPLEGDQVVEKGYSVHISFLAMDDYKTENEAKDKESKFWLDVSNKKKQVGQELNFVLGRNEIDPKLEEHILGMKVDDVKSAIINFPPNHMARVLADRWVCMAIKLIGAKKPELPPLDDALADQIADMDSVDQWREKVRSDLITVSKKECLGLCKGTILAQAYQLEDLPPLSESMLRIEIDYLISQMQMNLMRQNKEMTLDRYLEITQTTIEQLRSGFVFEATERLKIKLFLEVLFKTLKEANLLKDVDSDADREDKQRDIATEWLLKESVHYNDLASLVNEIGKDISTD